MRRILSVALVGVAAAALVLAAAAPAAAHNYVVESTPAEGEVLTALPEAWEVVTNETMLYADDAVFGLWARDADGLFYGDGCVEVTGSRMSAAPVIGAPGDYTLVYALISADGHPLTGEIPFEWAGEAEVATGSAEPARCGAAASEPEAAAPSSDAIWIVAALGAVGVAVIVAVLLTRRPKRRDDPTARVDPTT
jgi:methionine-rich copper-binding protein CopC